MSLRKHLTALFLVLRLGVPLGAQELEMGPALDFHHIAGTPEKRYIVETMGSGVAMFDYDEDGDLDIYFVNAGTLEDGGQPNRLFRNEGDWQFTDVTDRAGVGDRGFGQGVAIADIDNDGDYDLYATNYGPNVLYRNNGDGTFSPAAAGIEDPRWSTSAAFGDVDGDGFLDLYVCNYLDFDRELLDRLIPRRFCEWKGLQVQCGPKGFGFVSGALYHNTGRGGFEDWTEEAGVANQETYQLGVVFSDLDLDGDQDLYVATDTTLNLLFENLGDGRFRDVSLVSGAALSQSGAEQAGMGVDVGDVNGDGRLDLFVTNFSDDYNTLYLNQGGRLGLTFEDATDLAGLGLPSLSYLGWSTFLADLDADRDQDIFLVNGHVYPEVDGSAVNASFRQPMQIFLNRGDGTFENASQDLGPALSEPRSSRGAALGDLDGDASLDVVVNVMDGSPVVLRNGLTDDRRSVTLRLIGRSTNRDALGAVVRANVQSNSYVREVRGARGYLSHSDLRLYYGLGESPSINELTIRWPGGAQETLTDLAPGLYTVVEGVGIVFSLRDGAALR